MRKQEQELILCLIDRHNIEVNKNKILELLKLKLNWEYILGFLMYNRVAGIAYKILLECNPHEDEINREFKLNLFLNYSIQLERTKAMNNYLLELSDRLKDLKIGHAFLKGSILATTVYPEGCRISNDIDILVSDENLTEVAEALKSLGYIEGTYDLNTNTVIPATRKEILHCRINFGELMSFIKVVNKPGASMMLVDVNFSLRAFGIGARKEVEMYLSNVNEYKYLDKRITSLSEEYFLAHLCVHFYKEASDIRWISRQRDMTLYKIVDIYEVFNSNNFYIDTNKFLKLVKDYNIFNEVYYTFKIVSDIFPTLKENSLVHNILNTEVKISENIMNLVYDSSNLEYKGFWKMDTIDRLFAANRVENIEEV